MVFFLPPWSATVLLPVTAGIISHHVFWIRFEIDPMMPKIAFTALCLQPVLTLALHANGLRLLHSIAILAKFHLCYLISLFTSISIYRLYFHPLAEFPGPFWARLWIWWKISKYAEEEKAYSVVHALHQEYGDVVRIGPRQLSINDVDAIADIYGSKSVCGKAVQYEMGEHVSVQNVRSVPEHQARRRIWDRGLNSKACEGFVPRMSQTCDVFVEKLSGYHGQPVVVTKWCRFITFDTMSDIAFGRSFGQLEAGHVHPAIGAIDKFLKYAIYVWNVPWLFLLLQSLPGFQDPMTIIRRTAEESLRKREKDEPANPDVMSYILSSKETGSKWPLDDTKLISDVALLQVAGSDTSYSLFVHTFYYLARYPSFQASLLHEITAISLAPGTSPNWPELNALPLLNAFILEILRLHPPIPTGFTRNTPVSSPSTGIGHYAIPADTIISIPTYTIQHDARYFVSPDEFLPERWTTDPSLILDRRAFIPFSVGNYGCAGKAFALMETKVFVAKVVRAFEVSFAEEWDGERFMRENKDYVTWWCADLRVCLAPRRI